MSTWFVDGQNGNDSTGDGTLGNPFKSIGKGWNSASTNHIIDLSGYFDWYSDASWTATGLAINKSITFRGQSGNLARIDCCAGQVQSRWLNLNTSTVTVSLENLEIFNSTYSSQAPIGRSNLTMNHALTNCWIHDCSATAGHLYQIYGGNTYLTNVTFNDNYITGFNNVVNAGGGTKYLTNCTFYNNDGDNATSQYVYIGTGGTQYFINCTFFNNRHGSWRFNGAGTAAYIKNSIFVAASRNNTITTQGTATNINTSNNLFGENWPFNPPVTMYNPALSGGYANSTMPDASFGTFGLNESETGVPVVPIVLSNFAVGNGSVDHQYYDSVGTPLNEGPEMPTNDARGKSRIIEPGSYDIGAYAYNVQTEPEPGAPVISVYLQFLGAT